MRDAPRRVPIFRWCGGTGWWEVLPAPRAAAAAPDLSDICTEHIVPIKKVKDIFSTGYQIVHRQFELPKIIIFWVGCDRYFDRKLALWKHFVMNRGQTPQRRLQTRKRIGA